MEFSPSDKYLVYSSYYKHAETSVDFFASQEQFLVYLDDLFREYNDEHYWLNVRHGCLEDLISYAIEQGIHRIDNYIGWGIVNIARISGNVELYE